MDAPIRNAQNINDKHADQPVTTRVTPYRIHVLPLLYRRGWTQLNLKKMCHVYVGTADGGTAVTVLCHKSEGRWFDSTWCHWYFSLT
jgi:hypothetical protein